MEKSCNNCKYAFEEPDGEHCGNCSRSYVDQFIPMTNSDRIRNMPDEEIATMIGMIAEEMPGCVKCFVDKELCKKQGFVSCERSIEKWLQSQVEV